VGLKLAQSCRGVFGAIFQPEMGTNCRLQWSEVVNGGLYLIGNTGLLTVWNRLLSCTHALLLFNYACGGCGSA
jgi:hypothetical protein